LKNPKGNTVPLDKRLAAAGRDLQDVTINDDEIVDVVLRRTTKYAKG
jgi:hypothetical protein